MNLAPQHEDDFWKRAIANSHVRQEITRNNLLAFFSVYCAGVLPDQYPIAPFHKEIMGIFQDRSNTFFVLEGFRGSGKSSIASRAFAIWSIIGVHQVKFLVIIAQTQEQARQYLSNIKKLMLTEPLLGDMGPFEVPEGEWRSNAIDIPNYGARIVVASIEQPIRGLLHGAIRPQVVICDDLESISSATSTDIRQRLYRTFTSDILPMGDLNTRFIVIGTRLHEESLIMKLKGGIERGERDGIFRSYPIVDANGASMWPGKYPTLADIERERRKIANEVTWQREFELKIIPDDYQIIHREWIQKYDVLPDKEYRGTFIGIDLAISQKDTADYTAMVIGRLYHVGDVDVLYILPLHVNKRLTFPETVEMCKALNKTLEDSYTPHFIVEDVAYQRALPQILEQEGLKVTGVKIGTADKASRLTLTAHRIQTGRVLFPEHGAEVLLTQLVGFNTEKWNDMADAFSLLVSHVIENPHQEAHIYLISDGPGGDPLLSDWGWRPLFG